MSEVCRVSHRVLAARMPARRQASSAQLVGVVASVIALASSTLFAEVHAKYQYTLSNFDGRLPFAWTRIQADQARDEAYVIYQGLIRVFSPSGMEVFSFGDDLDVGEVIDLAVDDGGDVILLSYKDGRPVVTRCDFRGVPVGTLEIRGLPPSLAFEPNRMVYRNGLFYFASLGTGAVVVTDSGGGYREFIDTLALVSAEEGEKAGMHLFGFHVDQEGNVLFTIATLFRVYRLSPDKKLASFGRPGSAPGRFGIVAGIVTDSRGNIVVADRLKCVVMVFDRNFNFLAEFGYRGSRPENLVSPDAVAIDGHDRIYVTQGRRRGVSVFALNQE